MYKQSFFGLCFLIFTYCTQAQNELEKAEIESGRFLITGSIHIANQNSESSLYGNSAENISLRIGTDISPGIALANNHVVGLNLAYYYVKSQYTTSFGDYSSISRSYSIAPYYRYYHFFNRSFAFVGDVRISLGLADAESIQPHPNNSQTPVAIKHPKRMSIGTVFTPTVLWMPLDHWSLEASVATLQYSYSLREEDPNSPGENYSSNTFTAGFNLLNPVFGITYYF